MLAHFVLSSTCDSRDLTFSSMLPMNKIGHSAGMNSQLMAAPLLAKCIYALLVFRETPLVLGYLTVPMSS
jgi:hypothetical protein